MVVVVVLQFVEVADQQLQLQRLWMLRPLNLNLNWMMLAIRVWSKWHCFERPVSVAVPTTNLVNVVTAPTFLPA